MNTTRTPAATTEPRTLPTPALNGSPLNLDMRTAETEAGTLVGFAAFRTAGEHTHVSVTFSGWREGRDALGFFPVIVTDDGRVITGDPLGR